MKIVSINHGAKAILAERLGVKKSQVTNALNFKRNGQTERKIRHYAMNEMTNFILIT